MSLNVKLIRWNECFFSPFPFPTFQSVQSEEEDEKERSPKSAF